MITFNNNEKTLSIPLEEGCKTEMYIGDIVVPSVTTHNNDDEEKVCNWIADLNYIGKILKNESVLIFKNTLK